MASFIRRGIEELAHIEEDFFDIDESTGTARIELQFDSPESVFDTNYISKTPVLSDDFMEWLTSAFSLVSPKYKIDLMVRFKDMGTYTDDSLHRIFVKNLELEFKSRYMESRKRNKIAYSLIGIGLVFFALMIAITHFWNDESIWKEIITYISDIAATVTIWEALTILVVEQRENRAHLKNLAERFSAIRFLPL